jgi:hypothetical protein
MNERQEQRPFVRALCAMVALAALAASPKAAADVSTYQFTLSPVFGWEYVGSGYFTVDDTMIPDSGSFMAVATDLGGELVTGREFGYAFGNEMLEYLGGDPAESQNSVLIRTPHNDAVIAFEDGVPVGISYDEMHTCNVSYRCFPNHQIHLLGATYNVFDYPGLGAIGHLTIGPAIPEPSTVALMLGGLGAVLLVRRRGERLRSGAGALAPN